MTYYISENTNYNMYLLLKFHIKEKCYTCPDQVSNFCELVSWLIFRVAQKLREKVFQKGKILNDRKVID